MLRAAGAAEANLVIVTLNDFAATEDIVAALHLAYPELTILARGRDSEQCQTLRRLGAALAVSENFETSVELAREALMSHQGNTGGTEAFLRRFRDDYYARIGAAGAQPVSDRTDTKRGDE